MIHYTCDFCGSPIHGDEPRFEVRIEVRLSDGELEPWNLELADIEADLLDLLEIEGCGPTGEALHALHFDLCADCQAAFLSSPPVREKPMSLEYNN